MTGSERNVRGAAAGAAYGHQQRSRLRVIGIECALELTQGRVLGPGDPEGSGRVS